MGIILSRRKPDYEILIKTGDVKGAGTDSNIYCCLVDREGIKSRDILLDCKWRNDFETGSEDVFKITNIATLGSIECVELWRDNKGIADDWFVEYVKVRKPNKASKKTQLSDINGSSQFDWVPFPCNRWIEPDRKYYFYIYDSILPQHDKQTSQRKQELAEKQSTYAYESEITGLPRRVQIFPKTESFSNDYKWDIISRKVKYLAQKKLTSLFNSDQWTSLEDLVDVYEGTFGIPYGYNNWRSDQKFGQQRLTGCNATIIQRCSVIPPNFVVTTDMVEPFLDGLTLDEAMERKQIYIVDLNILENITCKDKRALCCPFALFYAKKNGEILPIAIQLFQQPAKDNPVFLPNDPTYTWMLAKMYYNNADAALHQSCTHLGFTHLVCESICISVHCCLAPSHPIFRLLSPHFLYLMAINTLAVQKLLAPEGWIDITMTMGACGLSEIVKRKWSNWRMNVEGWLPNDLKNRGVDDKEMLPSYYYRDDAMMLHTAIYDYVHEIINNIYDTPDKLAEDHEVQHWAAVLSDPVDGGGIKGVFGGGKFEVLDDLVKTIAATIFLSSVQHAAANFCQYDEYAFPPNYPATMYGEIIRDKRPRSEADILAALPDKETTLSIMVVTKLLSERGTNGIGDFEVQYQYEPKAVAAVEKFRAALTEISSTIKARNVTLEQPYPYLDPDEVPNAISI